MNFYKHFIGDYARDTAALSMIEHGAYRILLDTYYATAKPLPAAKSSLHRIAKAISAAERKAVDTVADMFFPVNGDGFRHNQRADKELATATEYADAQALRAHKRWDKQADMQAHKQAQCPIDASHSHRSTKEAADAAFWRLGVQVLTDAGTPEKQARAFLGKHYKNDRDKLSQVVGYLAAHPKIEPKAYIEAAMTPPAKKLAL